MLLTPHQAKYIAHDLTLQHAGGGLERLSQALFNASVDLNPHQIEAAVFALRSPLSKGVLLADEVGLGKTIEAGIVLCQYWAERKRQLLVICPASLRKQWALELQDKFNLPAVVLDSKTWREAQRQGLAPLRQKAVVVMSYAYATRIKEEVRSMAWDLVVIDEAHKLRNAYRESNKIGQAIRWATGDSRKLLLTATPLQNSILELYGLSTLIDDSIFGDINAFKSQFTGAGGDLAGLRQRLDSFCKRTLRKDVTEYIKYTERKAITQKFRSTDDEHRFYEAVSDYLTREDSYAIPRRQRHLTELVLRKLLASSSLAIAGTLGVMKERLQKLRDQKIQNTADWEQNDWIETLVSQEEMEEDLLDEILNASDETPETGTTAAPTDPAQLDRQRLNAEIAELDRLHAWAQGIGTDTKTTALLQALDVGFNAFAQMQTGGTAQRKALIFTESRRTQEYLKRFLEQNGHEGKVVLFSGTNSGPEASNIYERWLTANQGTGRISGSRDIDIRTALIEHFRDEADILIATEAAAEGVNMQFCSLVINYDLPWNPQRVEQRIGRCHRYGQKHDVVVINFFNERNHADARVLELLAVKFKLFDGVFGASDEVLGSIESGVDIERRILDIYRTCRTPAQIDAAFAALGQAMKPAIDERMAHTRSQLLEVFDAEVHERLRLQRQDTLSHLNQFSRRFWDLTRHVLAGQAWFDEAQLSFDLPAPTAAGLVAGISAGRYHLISREKPSDVNSLAVNDPSLDAHTYRLSHPLGEWVVHAACQASTPMQHLVFDTRQTEARVSVVEALRGQSGVLTLQKLTVDSFEKQEYLLFSALTDAGQSLDQETCEKLMATPATLQNSGDLSQATRLQQEAQRHADATVALALETNSAHFNEGRDKLDRWAEDMVKAAEQALKNTKDQIKVAQREARQATTLAEQQAAQERIAKLERQKTRQRREIYDVGDEIDAKRNQLIDQLTQRMKQKVQTEHLFTLQWTVT
ncbi:SNF2-related protein [Limnohabitans sp. WS1]|uniref:SNF2-related protein n=1 Tax=Limnohabitans sp. WS1 TaxID=1100726 RepID=UPI000D3834B1|nr:SNF2-related protein [Limnohabitans sp. WS1]PUE15187.1 ATP-dependent helicase [Limnohabitans sp. WS1]